VLWASDRAPAAVPGGTWPASPGGAH
jgi:hypothetical protein